MRDATPLKVTLTKPTKLNGSSDQEVLHYFKGLDALLTGLKKAHKNIYIFFEKMN